VSGPPASKRPPERRALPRQPGRQDLLRQVAELQAENARLREVALVDPLTGLHNYRHFLEQLDVEMERVRRTGAPCSLLMLDLDHFKQVNDLHGHEAGNTVLRQAAGLIKAGTRATDIACRYGGEEFAVILPATDLEGAVRIAERIRRAVKRRAVRHGESELKVTLSAGAACFRYLETTGRSELVQRADAALYEAKRCGRDRVCRLEVPSPATEVSPAEKELLK
jgi:two-component system cell cycle response regulator